MDLRRPFAAALLSMLCMALAAQGAARAAGPQDDAYLIPPRLADYDLSAVDQHVEDTLDRYSGGSCFIVIKDGRTLLRKAYGSYALDKVVSIASASKWLSGGVIMALVDEGKLSLDDTAGTFFSDFTGNKAGITVRQCFSHTSGFPFSTPNDFEPPRYSPNQDNSLESMEACVDIIATIPLDSDCDPPGSGFYYSGIGMQVAARMGEIRKKDGWQNIFMEKIGTPLGMTATDYYGSGFTNNPNAAGGVQANVDDLGKFVWMVANRGVYEGKRVLSEEAVETMLTNQTGNPPIVSSPATGLEEYAGHGVFRYGVGCWLERFDPDTGLGWEASSPGAFGCVPFVDLKRNLAGVFLPRTVSRFSVPGGGACNEGHAVYLEAKQMIQSIIPEDTVLEVLQNDPGGVRILSVSQPAHGTAVNHRSYVTYTPETGYVGSDSFTYTLDLGGGAASAPATVTINVNTKPEAEILGSDTYTVEEGELLALAGSGSDTEDGTNVAFDWDWGDGTPHGAGANPQHAWSKAGTYTVTMVAIDQNGLASDPVSVEVIVTPRSGDGDLYLKKGTFTIDWKAHAAGADADAFAAQGNLNLAGLVGLEGAGFELSVNGTSLGAVTLDGRGRGSGAADGAIAKVTLSARNGAFSITYKGGDLRAILGLANASEIGETELGVTVSVTGAGLDTPTSTARAVFAYTTIQDDATTGTFSFCTGTLSSGVFFAAKTTVAQAPDGSHKVQVKGHLAVSGGGEIAPAGDVHVMLGDRDLDLPPASLGVAKGVLGVAKDAEPALPGFALDTVRRKFKIATALLDGTGVPLAGEPATAHDLLVRVVIPKAGEPLILETTVEILRKDSNATRWKR